MYKIMSLSKKRKLFLRTKHCVVNWNTIVYLHFKNNGVFATSKKKY